MVYIVESSYPLATYSAILNLGQKPQSLRGSRDMIHSSKSGGGTLKRMSGMCKNEERSDDAQTLI